MRTIQLSSSPRSWQSAGLRLTSVGPPELAASRAAWRREEVKAPSPGLAQGALGETIGVDHLMRQHLRRRQFASKEPRFKPSWKALLRSPNGSTCVHAHAKRSVLPNRWDARECGGSGICYARRAPDCFWMASVWPTTVVVFGWASKYNICISMGDPNTMGGKTSMHTIR